MASNGRGGMRPQHSSRTPPFVLVGLLVVCAILAFNYWNASSKNNMLVKDLSDLQDKFRTLSMKKIAVEKRNDALLEKVKEGDTEIARHKGLIGEKEGDVENLKAREGDLQNQLNDAKENLNTCDEKQHACLGSLNTVEAKLNDSEANVQKANEECNNRIASQNDANKITCSEEAQRTREDILTKIQDLLGHAALMVLQEAGMDTSGVSLNPSAVGRHSLCANQQQQQPQSNIVQNPPVNNMQMQPVQGDPLAGAGGFVNNAPIVGQNQNLQPPDAGVAQQQPGVGDANQPNLNQVVDPNGPAPVQPNQSINNELPLGNNLAINPPPQGNDQINPNAGVSENLAGEKANLSDAFPKPAEANDEVHEVAEEEVPIGVPIGQEPAVKEAKAEELENKTPSTTPVKDDEEIKNEEANIQAPPGAIGDEEEEEDEGEEEEEEDHLAPVGIKDVQGEDKQEDFDDEIDPNEPKNEALKFDADKEQDVNGAGDIDAEEDTIDNMHQKMNDDAENLDSARDMEDQINL